MAADIGGLRGEERESGAHQSGGLLPAGRAAGVSKTPLL
jgi:hypothetical protein